MLATDDTEPPSTRADALTDPWTWVLLIPLVVAMLLWERRVEQKLGRPLTSQEKKRRGRIRWVAGVVAGVTLGVGSALLRDAF